MLVRIISILLFPLAALGAGVEDWKLYVPEAANSCKAARKGFEIRADFDGNGRADVARLQESATLKRRRVAVWMNGSSRPVILAESPLDQAGNFLVLEKPRKLEAFDGVSSSTYMIALPSLGYGTCESSEEVFQWDSRRKKFVGTTVSD